MLKIKLMRIGKKNQGSFRIVVNEAKSKNNGIYADLIGYYRPAESPKKIKIDIAKYRAWIKKGAQPTQTVANLFKQSNGKTA